MHDLPPGSADHESEDRTCLLDPIEEAITQGLGHRELLHRVAVELARMAALLGWIRANPGHFSLTKQLDVSRAVGRRQRALMALVATSRAEAREGAEADPPPETVDRVVGMLREEVLGVLEGVASLAQIEEFRARLDKDAPYAGSDFLRS